MAVRNADDILVGGGRIFIVEQETGSATKSYYDLGYLQGEIKHSEQANSQTIKESEGGTVLTIATDKEVHFTFSLLEANLDTLKLLNPSSDSLNESGSGTSGFAVGTFQSDDTFLIEFYTKKRSGKYRCLRIFKGKISGEFTTLLINQDNASPIPVDVVALADDTKPTTKNLYEIFDTSTAPNGGW